MLLKVSKLNKHIGVKVLLEDAEFLMNENEKVALIGRNGYGKSTLLGILGGTDKEYEGEVEIKRDSKIVMTKQEHHMEGDVTVLEYILNSIPEYTKLKQILHDYENQVNDVSLEEYSESLEVFTQKDYYTLEDRIMESLNSFQIDLEKTTNSIQNLSGGEKRFVELVRVMYSNSNLALVDEPTNHMDYVGKDKFIKWLKDYNSSILIVSHDRDVLKYVDKIFELRDRKISVFNGNYDQYLKQNTLNTLSSIKDYENKQHKIKKLNKQLDEAKTLKGKGSRKSARILRDRIQRSRDRAAEETDKPSFWIDQETLKDTPDKMSESYHKFKDKSIRVNVNKNTLHQKLLLDVKNLSLGYKDSPIFEDITFEIHTGDRIFLKGRNGAGKTTLIKKILENTEDLKSKSKVLNGEIKTNNHLKVGYYEQEVKKESLNKTLRDAVIDSYEEKKVRVTINEVNAILSAYLFDPTVDGNLEIAKLSGGQKARYQLIRMLAGDPNLLILDEPTNHLDLPSIEEMENALLNFAGGILYTSHDTYFIDKIGGKQVTLGEDFDE